MEDTQSDQTPYQRELRMELAKLNPADFSHATRLLTEENRRVESGDKYKCVPMVDLHSRRPSSNAVKCRIPIQDYPKINFVGKLLGPKGNTLKTLQQETGCKLSILGRGSMRDKSKEEELRKEGGKYAHLNEDLHVMVECFAQAVDAYGRINHAIGEIQKFMDPSNYDMESGAPLRDDQQQQQPYFNGEDRMLGGPHGQGPPPGQGGRGGLLSTPALGGRGGMAPRGGGSAPRGAPAPRGDFSGAPRGDFRGASSAPRGAPSSRGQPPAVRSGPPVGRGGMSSRGTPPPRGAPGGRGGGRGLPSLAQPSRAFNPPVSRPQPLAQEYDDYGAGAAYDQEPEYGQASQYDDGYGRADPYAERQSYSAPSAGAGDTQYFDYGHGAQTYKDDYAEPPPSRAVGYERNNMRAAAPAPRGRGSLRPHPYDSGRGQQSHGRVGGY